MMDHTISEHSLPSGVLIYFIVTFGNFSYVPSYVHEISSHEDLDLQFEALPFRGEYKI
jgi:hypothetical protein